MRAAGPQSSEIAAPGAGGLRTLLGTLSQRIASVEREIPRIARQPATRGRAPCTTQTAGRAVTPSLWRRAPSPPAPPARVEGLAEAFRPRRAFVVPVGRCHLARARPRAVVAERQGWPQVEPIEVGRVTEAWPRPRGEGDGARDVAIGRSSRADRDGSWGLEVGEPFLIRWRPRSTSARPPCRALRAPRSAPLPRVQPRLESRSPSGRPHRSPGPLALEANLEAGRPIDQPSSRAAVYMHEVGMALVRGFRGSRARSAKQRHLERRAIRRWRRASSSDRRWDECGKIIARHTTSARTQGLPRGLDAHYITRRARLLAVLDAFEP